MENYKSISPIVTVTLSRNTEQHQFSPNNIHYVAKRNGYEN